MSNGENAAIADSWEEIDDDKLTNQLDKIKKEAEESQLHKKIEDDRMPLQNGNIPALMLAMRPDDGNYSAYKPGVKILRRPTQSSDSRNSNDKPKQPIKTLQQREQEYAEARLRILGSAKNPEDELEAALDKLLTTKISEVPPVTMGNNSINFNSSKSNMITQQQLLLSSLTYHSPERSTKQKQQSTYSSNRELYDTHSFDKAISDYHQGLSGSEPTDFNNRVTQDNIIRMPRGPDSTGGFNVRR